MSRKRAIQADQRRHETGEPERRRGRPALRLVASCISMTTAEDGVTHDQSFAVHMTALAVELAAHVLASEGALTVTSPAWVAQRLAAGAPSKPTNGLTVHPSPYSH